METPSGPAHEEASSLVGRRFLDRADAAGRLSARLADVAERVFGVRAILAVDPGGELIVAETDTPGVDAEELAALAATLVILAVGSSASCAMGPLSHIVVELEMGTLVVQPLADGTGALVVLADPLCDLADLVDELGPAAGRLVLPSAYVAATPDDLEPTGRPARPERKGRRFVRPFVLTGGRTESPVAADALVWCLLEPMGRISSEQIAVLHACQKPRSITEIAEVSGLPLGVVRVVVGDLMAAGWVAASMFDLPSQPSDLYPRIIEALQALA